MTPVLELRDITKIFPGVVANSHISFTLERGEVHALLGENGAGKSTLMNIISGVYQADEGQIFLDGKPMGEFSSREAIEKGIGMVHQHFMLIPAFTVAENIILGMGKSLRLNLHKEEEEIRKAGAQFEIEVDPCALVSELSVGERQRVEILKALVRNAKVLILDEPTAVLTPQETTELFATLRRLKASGVSIIFISHKLNEVMAISDRISILRRGEMVESFSDMAAVNPAALASAMVGRQTELGVEKPDANPKELVLDVKNLNVAGDSGRQAVCDFNVQIRSGEIVGLAGVEGNGQSELVKALTGLAVPTSGQITLDGRELAGRPPLGFLQAGLGHIPEDRHDYGLVLPMTVEENLVLETFWKKPFVRRHFLRQQEIRSFAQRQVNLFDIRTPSEEEPAENLSGGNQQKVVLARTFSKNPRIIVAAHPTRGLDIHATEFVRNCLLKARVEGCAILLVSTELDEIMALSDRIVVMYKGRKVGEVDGAKAEKAQLGAWMAGKAEA